MFLSDLISTFCCRDINLLSNNYRVEIVEFHVGEINFSSFFVPSISGISVRMPQIYPRTSQCPQPLRTPLQRKRAWRLCWKHIAMAPVSLGRSFPPKRLKSCHTFWPSILGKMCGKLHFLTAWVLGRVLLHYWFMIDISDQFWERWY